MKQIILKSLKFYKRYLSFGNHCRFDPSCSVYAYQAVEKYGVIRGLWLGLVGLVHCHPWSKGNDRIAL
ncbi:MAG: membrane protein insertion efficiency factor YidD [Candidatus Shapirobacteria bacterium]